ncbi:hypothetical protein EWM64_g4662 [Hericium alpestre]|uniref:Uncharacterized protein n=1 Tax=Hericium alpestre TaxID=135208 RepID=A0A4Y9ZYT5_9AGAM|nr:hypothetical protein EWM64_g4662 [Hericium alpestre]
MPTRNSGSLRLRLPSRSSSRKLASSGPATLRTPHKPGMAQAAAAVYPTPPPSAKSVVANFTFSPALDDGSDSYTSEDNWEAASARSRRSVSSSREHMDCFGASPVISETCPAKRPSDSDEESDGPFHYDILLSSDECMSADSSSLVALLPPALRRLPSHCVSITPLPSSPPEDASVASRRFSLVRTETSEGTVFTREIGDAQGKRWSIRVPARGLPQDMLAILDELEQLATEFTDKPTPSPSLRIPRIVVTQSQSLDSIRKMANALEHEKPRSPGLLRPPSPISDDDDADEYESKSGSVPFPASSVSVESIASNSAAGQCARTQRPPLQGSKPRESTTPNKPACNFQSNRSPIDAKPASAPMSANIPSMPSESSLPYIYLPDIRREGVEGVNTLRQCYHERRASRPTSG